MLLPSSFGDVVVEQIDLISDDPLLLQSPTGAVPRNSGKLKKAKLSAGSAALERKWLDEQAAGDKQQLFSYLDQVKKDADAREARNESRMERVEQCMESLLKENKERGFLFEMLGELRKTL